MEKCNHLGFGHNLCRECGAIVSCDGCGEKIKFDFWNTAFDDKIEFLIKREKEFEERNQKLAEREKMIKNFINVLNIK